MNMGCHLQNLDIGALRVRSQAGLLELVWQWDGMERRMAITKGGVLQYADKAVFVRSKLSLALYYLVKCPHLLLGHLPVREIIYS